MAGFDMNRNPAPAKTKEPRPKAVARAGDRLREVAGGMPDHTKWFFVALVGGAGVILLIKGAFANAWFAAVAAAVVVLALTIYYIRNDEGAPEEEGDNVYYLGFLFTLISLVFALVKLLGAGEDSPNQRVLLENFGIALTSTIAGIAGRVAVQNWQRGEFVEGPKNRVIPPPPSNPQDLEMFNRQLLGRIASDLTQGAGALARFHRIVRSHASNTEDYLRNHSETLKQESTAFKDTLQFNAKTFAQELDRQSTNTLKTIEGSLGAAAKQAETLLERLQSVHERTGKAFDALESGLGHASDASATFGNTVQRVAKLSSGLELDLHKLHAAITANAATATARTKKSEEVFDALIRSLRASEDETRRATEALIALTKEAEARTEALRQRQGFWVRFWKRSR